MNTTTIAPPNNPKTADLLEVTRSVCKRIAPLWPLQNFVAVNPFLGLAEKPFIDSCELIRKVAPGGMQMPLDFYREKFESGEIQTADLEAALTHAAKTLPETWMPQLEILDTNALKSALGKSAAGPSETEIPTVADAIDRATGSRWAAHVAEVISQFCAGYYDSGQSAWRQPWAALPLFTAWRETASLDAKPEYLGLSGFRKHVAALPEEPEEAIAHALGKLGISAEAVPDFLHRQLMSIRGWAGHVQYLVRENGMAGREDDSLIELLAIRISYETALLEKFGSPAIREAISTTTTTVSDQTLVKFLWQLAHENAWQRQLFGKLLSAKPPTAPSRPSAQAVFCIDVRSEVFRRALESANPKVQTMGFAGFFGMAIEHIPFGQHHGGTQCPVLLNPAYRIRETISGAGPEQLDHAWKRQRTGKRLGFSWDSFKSSAISCFSFVETAGLAFGPKLFSDSFAPSAKKTAHTCAPEIAINDDEKTGIPAADRIKLALGALGHMGLRKNFARLVLICGHGSSTTNNPYGSGLDCGACGGHAGDANARVAAAILNDPAVRTALVDEGITIPEDTHFLAGLHNTTTDDVALFDTELLPESHKSDLADLEQALALAGETARLERAVSLGLDPASPGLDKQVRARALDWAEVRPEWGLAGNAAFIAAPRARTKHAQLNGRVFLHDYDHAADTGEATLELIMVAPMVVASWINLQYYASTVNNDAFGSGNKVTHNVTGTLGVCQGNAGDLQTGLPMQSVHDGEKWVHEPLRLHVFIEAPRESLSAVLEKHSGVRDLVTNGWVILFSIEDEGKTHHRHLPDGTWEKIQHNTAA